MINLIVAMDRNGVIGIDGSLPWYLPNDLKFFKDKTSGNTIIMGRKCFESIGRALPNRKNIVLSRTVFTHKNVEWYSSIEEVLELPEDIFIIGGSQIYEAFLPYVDRLFITKIDHEFEGDTFFPEVNFDEWNFLASAEYEADAKNVYKHSFNIFDRKKRRG